jgi:ribokinase
VALIFVEVGGQNQIVVASGANARLAPEDVTPALEEASGGFLLLQLESPMETIERAASLGRRQGMTVVLDPAPARPISGSLLANVDVLTPNESEAMLLLDRHEGTVSLDEAKEVARALLRLGPRAVILKLGEKGAFLDDGTGGRHVPGLRVEAVDATAAGDTFNGALAVALAENQTMPEALAFANAAAAISVTRLGAQASIPGRDEVEAALAR